MTDKYGREHTDGSRSGGQPVDDIEAKALALTRTVLAEQGTYFEERTSLAGSIKFDRSGFMAEALCRALEQHEATKQERDNLATALKETAAACADHVNTILQLRSELAAFKQEVSEALFGVKCYAALPREVNNILDRFIIPKPKPDPLEQVIAECDDGTWETIPEYAEKFRAALGALGFEIREKGQ